jgi:hypothetical protein
MNEYPESPVPSDRALWPGELPFTAFGQFGRGELDLRVFDQDIWWIDRDGAAHRIAEISSDYVEAVVMFLREHQHYFHLGVQMRWAIQAAGDAMLVRPVIPEPAPRARDVDASSWLEGTRLMLRLRAPDDDRDRACGPPDERGLLRD